MLGYKKFFFLVIILILPILLYSQPITPVWIRTYNDPSATQAHEFPSGLAVDNSGKTYITMSAINESWRKWRWIKYDGAGTLKWQDSLYSTHGECEPTGLAINGNGNDVYVTGYCRFGDDTVDNIYTVKINGSDNNGHVTYIANYQSEDDDCAKAIAIDNNYVYVTGYVDLDFGSSGRDRSFCTIKYNKSTLDTEWVRCYPTSPNNDTTEEACAIAVHNGNVYVTGRTGNDSRWDWLTISYDADGNVRNEWPIYWDAAGYDDEPKAITIDDDENIYITGYSELSSINSDFYTISYKSNGDLRWGGGKRYNGTGNGKDCAYAIALDEVGHVYVAGSSEGDTTNEDFLIIAYNTSNGGVSWSIPPNGDSVLRYNLKNRQDSAMAIAVEKDGSWLYVTGEARPSLKDKGDYMTRFYELPPSANSRVFYHEWDGVGYFDTLSLACDSEDYATKIVFDDNSVWVTGSSMGSDFSYHNLDCVTIKYGKTSHDVGCEKIIAPLGTIDSGTVVTPACSVYNYGIDTVSYRVRMKIGTPSNWFYNDTAHVSTQPPCSLRYITFPSYSNWPRGTYTVKCSTELSCDMNKSNDKKTDSVIVRVKDVGCSKIIVPSGTIDSGTVVAPACSVYNYGTTIESYYARMSIGNLYNESTYVSTHSPGSLSYVTFPNWTALPRGTLTVKCSTKLAADANKPNDKKVDSVLVAVHDVGCTKIIAPTGTIDSGTAVVTPACSVYNYGSAQESYRVRMKIDGFYNETTYVSNHSPGNLRYITFPGWIVQQRGNHIVKCSTELVTDVYKTNDLKTDSVFVRVVDIGCSKIEAPSGTIDSGTVVTPACSVYNYGNVDPPLKPYSVRMKIGRFYDQTAYVTRPHNPGTAIYVTFLHWVATQVGTHIVTCSTQLFSDMNKANDKKTGSVTVRRGKGGGENNELTAITNDSGGVEAQKPDEVNSEKIDQTTESNDSGVITPIYQTYNQGNMGSTIQIKTVINGEANLRIYNVLGKLLHSEKSNDGLFTMDGLPTGIYILRLQTKNRTEIRKLLIVK